MTSASMSFGRPVRVTFPRGALWFGNLAAFLIRSLSRPSARPSARADGVQVSAAATPPDALPPRCRAFTTLDKE